MKGINKIIIFLLIIFINNIIRRFYIKNNIVRFKKNQLTNKSKKVSIIIPFYNEENVILNTINDIVKLNLQGELILVNDGSTDNSIGLINNYIVDYYPNNFNIKLYHYTHKGKGYALKFGFQKAKYDSIVMTDADEEFDINSIPKMIDLHLNTGNTIIAKRKEVSIDKKLYSFIYWIFFGIYLNEPTSGTRVFNKSVLDIINDFTNDFTIELILNKYMGENTKIQYIDVDYKRRTIEEGKKLNGNIKLQFFLNVIIIFFKHMADLTFIHKIFSKKSRNISGITKKTNNDFKDIEHISIILDGNRRYSNQNNLLKKFQHLLGMIKMNEIVEYLSGNIKILSVYAFATNNWKRDEKEVNNILCLIDFFFKYYKKGELYDNIKVNFVTTCHKFTDDIIDKIKNIEEMSNKISIKFPINIFDMIKFNLINNGLSIIRNYIIFNLFVKE
ncbi:Putative undecaprenyl diphosphate synthase [seawater metagenome]|uniref:Undecaprenyl diphosphate synthase n=1 Tax=seawater metagenome TaxID=1561972 RepID=A0A5E8CJV0_9ZZZZ